MVLGVPNSFRVLRALSVLSCALSSLGVESRFSLGVDCLSFEGASCFALRGESCFIVEDSCLASEAGCLASEASCFTPERDSFALGTACLASEHFSLRERTSLE